MSGELGLLLGMTWSPASWDLRWPGASGFACACVRRRPRSHRNVPPVSWFGGEIVRVTESALEARFCAGRTRRAVVIGTAGSGKTDLASQLAQRLGVAHVELDALHWGPNWSLPTAEGFRERVATALAGDAWVADGNYSAVRDIVWRRAELVVWLDYRLPLILVRLVCRTLGRVISREELWGGNRETLRGAIFSRDSLLWWVVGQYRRRRREYPLLFQQPEHAHLQVVRVRSPREAEEWLEGAGLSCLRVEEEGHGRPSGSENATDSCKSPGSCFPDHILPSVACLPGPPPWPRIGGSRYGRGLAIAVTDTI